MDKLVAERETEIKEKLEIEAEVQKASDTEAKITEAETPSVEAQRDSSLNLRTEYLNSLENITVADYKRKEEEKKLKEFEQEKELLIQKQFETVKKLPAKETKEIEERQEVSQNIIEKPNYDLIQENSKVVKLSKKQEKKKSSSKKRLSLVLSIVLGVASVICLSNIIAVEQMSANLSEIEYELYEVNLPKYLKNIADLDSAKKGMDFIETYPEDFLDAGEIGEKSNWFDKLCGFLSGLFGG